MSKHTASKVTEGMVVGGQNSRKRAFKPNFAVRQRLKGRRTFVVVTSVVILGAVLIAGLYIQHRNAPKPAYAQISNKKYAQNVIKDFNASPLPANASVEEKGTRLKTLIDFQYTAGDYAACVSAFKQLQNLDNGSQLDETSYISAAFAYKKTGDDQTARTMFDKAQQLDEKITDVDVRADRLDDLSRARKELGL
jgi:tetratricopeptide (TPR) repeat protein